MTTITSTDAPDITPPTESANTILFCHFAPGNTDYTPIDIGFVIACLRNRFGNRYSFRILRLDHVRPKGADQAARRADRQATVARDAQRIIEASPHAVFLCLESVLWSKVFALGRARRVAAELRRKCPNMFIGLQSHKIQAPEIDAVLGSGEIDCVVTGDPETVFLELPGILNRHPTAGVCHDHRHENTVLIESATTPSRSCVGHRALDDLPSPYLTGIFDDFLHERQASLHGRFRAFLVSSRGCGFGCYYCFRSVKFEKVRYFSARRFYDEMEYLLNRFAISRFFVLDDAFLYSKRRLVEFQEEFHARIEMNPGLSRARLFVMARPETVDEEIVDILASLNVICIQIGLQTVNPALQHYMKRSVDTLHFQRIRHWMVKHGMKLQLDVVVGLPGDSIEWMKETLRFALLLSPFSLQIKQFYLNPNTLFHRDCDQYEIEIDTAPSDFDAPYVVKAAGIDARYFDETNAFIMEQIGAYPEVLWKYLSRKKRFLSELFYRRPERATAL